MSRPTCPCGHDRHHDRVQPVLRLGPWRWFVQVLLDGADLPPRDIRFVCRACETTIETTRNPDVLRAYRHWPLVDRAALRS